MSVLKAVIDDYIETADPVGSRSIARKHKLGVSPATIRNEMSDLEEIGYLQQPHVSAGRIPSDLGYRFYVDVLMEPQAITEEESKKVHGDVMAHRQEMDQLIHEASRILAMLTRSISLVVAPPVEGLTVRHIQLTCIDEHTILLVLVLNPSMVQNRIMQVQGSYSAEELDDLSKRLNKKVKGLTYRGLTASMVRDLMDYGEIGEGLVDALAQGLARQKQEQMHLNGALQIFNQPEFKDIDRARTLLEVLEEREDLLTLLGQLSNSSGIKVVIGTENPKVEMQQCSLVTATYHIGGNVIGSIGVMGPTRMEYSRIYSVVDLVADSLSETLTELMQKK